MKIPDQQESIHNSISPALFSPIVKTMLEDPAGGMIEYGEFFFGKCRISLLEGEVAMQQRVNCQIAMVSLFVVRITY